METLQSKDVRVPVGHHGLQVNFCKNPVCPNFGTPAATERQPKGHQQTPRKDSYKIIGSAHMLQMKCGRCGECPPIKSNLAIFEEIERLSGYLAPVPEPTCPAESCSNRLVGISTPKAYYSFGKTNSGSQRYRCRLCNTTFAVSTKATLRQRLPEVNEMVFKLLVNKMPMKRICETAGINIGTLYRKIDFIHKQCLEFAASYERMLPIMEISRLYLSVDRQEYWRVE